MHKPLVVIAGPTASGKSALALEIAKKHQGELICADSRTVYKGLDIGTAKPTLAEQREIPHHLLDVVDPGQPFTAADFKRRALAAIDDICARGKLPILVGGTGLYIDAVIFDYRFGKLADPSQRTRLQAMSVDELQQMCQDGNIPMPANSQNKRHLVRAIELGGLMRQTRKLRSGTIIVAITTDKDILRGRIQARTRQMIKNGVLKEVAEAGERYNWSGEALTGNIYRILRPVVLGELSLEEGLAQVVMSDMRLAKRQVTWLKRNPFVIWGTRDELEEAVEHFVQQNISRQSIPPHS
jgi:tRNA dimethylallyltransferase